MRLTQKQLDKALKNGARVVAEVGGGSSRTKAVVKAMAPAKVEREPLPLTLRPGGVTLPGLRLRSWNRMVGSKKKGDQALAKHEAQAAVEAAREAGLLRRYACPVELHIVQLHAGGGQRWDVANLCTKYLIDALVNAGCLPDDNREVIPRVTVEAKIGDTAVEVHFFPEEED